MYPDVLVAAPVAVGISEHHMKWGPTISVSPQAWLAVVYEATESLVQPEMFDHFSDRLPSGERT